MAIKLTKFLYLFVGVVLISGHINFVRAADSSLNQYGINSINPYVVNRYIVNGKSIDEVIVPSRPEPSGGKTMETVIVPVSSNATGTVTISNVPALSWVFGCATTSAAMMFGYYDNIGYPEMYSGPANSGVFPMNNSIWGSTTINDEYRALCPLSATMVGLDGRTIKGHVDDYWVKYNSSASDPYIDAWPEHTHGDCTGDFMGTNQSAKGNSDGSTTFYFYTDGTPLEDYYQADYIGKRDGCHGLKLFSESRGTSVITNYSQYIIGYGGLTSGFSYTDFKNEIDAGRPVLIHVEGHTMLGFGYNTIGSIIYLHDTWDYDDHSMTWGGTYDGMQQFAVTVLQLEPTSVSQCPDCSGDVVVLENIIFQNGTTCECSATTSITIGSSVTIESGAAVSFTAPVVTIQNGFHAEEGSSVQIKQ